MRRKTDRQTDRQTDSQINLASSMCRFAQTKGETLETSGLESLYGGQFTLSTQLIKPNYFVTPPTDAAP